MDITLLWPLGLTVLLAIGAYTDVTARRLPNWLSLALLVTGLAFAATQGGWSAVGWHGAHAGIALLVGMALFATGGIGGGDAKFYTGLAAWFALTDGMFNHYADMQMPGKWGSWGALRYPGDENPRWQALARLK